MLKSYGTIVEDGQVTWTLDHPMVQSARVIVTIVEELLPRSKRRTASPMISGLGKTIGDVVSPIVDEEDWECLT